MKRMKKWILITTPSLLVVLFAFNNCGRMGELNEGTKNLSSFAGPEEVVNSEKLGLPYALLSAEQTLASMLKVTNTAVPTANILNEYNARYGALAAGNDLSMTNAPLVLGSTSLAGEICRNLADQERALPAETRNFFGSVNFATGVSAVSDATYNSIVRGMARSFWGRSENSAEAAMLMDFKTEFINAVPVAARTQAASTNSFVIATCAAMLSSVESITY